MFDDYEGEPDEKHSLIGKGGLDAFERPKAKVFGEDDSVAQLDK